MRKRNIQIITRLNKEENERFKKQIKKSGLSQEAYIRYLINGLIPTDAPPPEYFDMMKQLYYIGNNMNQLTQKAHALNVIDSKRYDENVAMLNKVVIEITNAVMLPRKSEFFATRKTTLESRVKPSRHSEQRGCTLHPVLMERKPE